MKASDKTGSKKKQASNPVAPKYCQKELGRFRPWELECKNSKNFNVAGSLFSRTRARPIEIISRIPMKVLLTGLSCGGSRKKINRKKILASVTIRYFLISPELR